jgi:hypothetical protein
MRKAPAYMIILLNVARPGSDTSQDAQILPLTGFLPLAAVPLIEVRRYMI